MQKIVVAGSGRSAAQVRRVLVVALLVVVALGAGVVLGGLLAGRDSAPPPARPAVGAPAPEPAPAEESSAEGGMSARALAQYRAFYAQQLASEAELERWSPPAVMPTASPAQPAFSAQQLASEAELERWSPPAADTPAVADELAVPIVVDGAQFE